MVIARRIVLLMLFSFMGTIAAQNETMTCRATIYHNKFENRKTSGGEIFSQKRYTAAHHTIALHTLVKVTNPANNYSVLVKINDRCPKKGILDLSLAAAEAIDLHKVGTTKVQVEILNNSFAEMWEKQIDSLPPIIRKRRQQDSLRKAGEDSLLFATDFGIPEHVRYFSVRIASASTENECRYIRLHLPEEYRTLVRARFQQKTRKYEIVLGPFFTRVEAEECIKRVKKKYSHSSIETID